MKIISLKTNPNLYSGKTYLLLGSWNTLSDVNTVIDTGSDDFILKEIESTNTGLGKVAVDKVILTHNHFDHMGGAQHLKKKFQCKVYAKIFTDDIVDEILNDGEEIRIADRLFTIIYTPGHSTDSICLYCKEDQVLFSGDTQLQIRDSTATYDEGFVEAIKKLSLLPIKVIYPGHGDPIIANAEKMIQDSLAVVLKSRT